MAPTMEFLFFGFLQERWHYGSSSQARGYKIILASFHPLVPWRP
jgi:hypothetical protein